MNEQVVTTTKAMMTFFGMDSKSARAELPALTPVDRAWFMAELVKLGYKIVETAAMAA